MIWGARGFLKGEGWGAIPGGGAGCSWLGISVSTFLSGLKLFSLCELGSGRSPKGQVKPIPCRSQSAPLKGPPTLSLALLA